jgi:uncharacterized protein
MAMRSCVAFAVMVMMLPAPAFAQEAKLARLLRSFQATWEEAFAATGRTFPVPRFKAYRFVTPSACGTVPGGNAMYCDGDNTIYYDVNFARDLTAKVARITGTDGDYAPATILAHELGHAVSAQMQDASLSLHERLNYRVNGMAQEILADCLAGAVTGTAERRGELDANDAAEGRALMTIIGTPQSFEATLGEWIKRHAQEHPPAETRLAAFRRGYERGTSACGQTASRVTLP